MTWALKITVVVFLFSGCVQNNMARIFIELILRMYVKAQHGDIDNCVDEEKNDRLHQECAFKILLEPRHIIVDIA